MPVRLSETERLSEGQCAESRNRIVGSGSTNFELGNDAQRLRCHRDRLQLVEQAVAWINKARALQPNWPTFAPILRPWSTWSAIRGVEAVGDDLYNLAVASVAKGAG